MCFEIYNLSHENEHLNTESKYKKEDEEKIDEEQELENLKPIHMPYVTIDQYQEVEKNLFKIKNLCL